MQTKKVIQYFTNKMTEITRGNGANRAAYNTA